MFQTTNQLGILQEMKKSELVNVDKIDTKEKD